jgi:hypothetical protein
MDAGWMPLLFVVFYFLLNVAAVICSHRLLRRNPILSILFILSKRSLATCPYDAAGRLDRKSYGKTGS